MQLRNPVVDRVFVGLILGAGLAACQAASTSAGSAYPNKPIRLVSNTAGGGADAVARLMAPGLTTAMGQQVIVDNRGNGVIPGQIVSRATPDGYTLLVSGGSFWLAPLTIEDPPYQALKDFAPVTLICISPLILVAHPSVAANSVRDLIALAKAKPGEINYASGSTGSASNLAAELFKSMAGVNITRISYKGNGAAVIDVIGGRVPVMFVNASTVVPYVKSGKLKALAVATEQMSALAPNVPTIAASGLPGYEASTKLGLFAPAKTSDAIVGRLNQESVRFIRTPEAKEQIFRQGADAAGSSPEQFVAVIKSDLSRMGKLIKDLGVKAE